MTTYQAPHKDPESWDSAIFTAKNLATIRIPPRKGVGTAVVSLPSAGKLDSKTAAGKKGATVTRQGAKDAKVTIVYEYAAQYFDEVNAGLEAIDPRGPSLGGPFRLGCPNLPDGFDAIQIEEISPRGTAAVEKGRGRVTITGKETTFPKTGSGTGAGKGKPKALAAAEKAALESAIEEYKRLAAIGAAEAAATSGNAEALAVKNKEVGALHKKIAELQRELDEGSSVPEAAGGGSETETPKGPGNAVGQGVQNAFDKLHDPASYKPGANKAAPHGKPEATGHV